MENGRGDGAENDGKDGIGKGGTAAEVALSELVRDWCSQVSLNANVDFTPRMEIIEK